MKSIFLISLLALAAQSINLASTSAFINFVERVNSGTSYEGTTVLLNVDIEFTPAYLKRFEPIGKSITKAFLGVFNGQGHVIRNLALNKTDAHQYAALFGHTRGASIKNIVLDSSCSISSATSEPAALGGVLAYCQGGVRSCELENTVNMAQITFSGSLDSKLAVYIGGIAGRIYADKYPALVRNCANYADLVFSGNEVGAAYAGGVLGECRGASAEAVCAVQNTLNYGNINIERGTFALSRVGGIVGSAYHAILDSCVNDGAISVTGSSDHTGTLVGYALGTQLDLCFYSSTHEAGFPVIGGNESSWMATVMKFSSETYDLEEEISVSSYRGTSLIGALNGVARLYYLRDFSNWTTNKDRKSINFTITKDRTSFSFIMRHSLMLLPGLAAESRLAFNGWFTDEKCTQQLRDFELKQDMTLYTKWQNNRNKYVLLFDTNGGPQLETLQLQYLAKTTLRSDITKNGCPISHWENIYGEVAPWEFTMPNHYVNLTAVWKCDWISSLDDFVEFSRRASAGERFEGRTVALLEDIVFTDEASAAFTPIPNFVGTFDGQGHSIKNLRLEGSADTYVGLFGHSDGMAIKNLVIADSTFSSDSSGDKKAVYVGAAIGACEGTFRDCTVENVVSTAAVEFTGASETLYLGGIVGYTTSSTNKITFKNCANYGTMGLDGEISRTSRVGGIVGYCSGSSSTLAQIVASVSHQNVDLAELNRTDSAAVEAGVIAGSVQHTEMSFSLALGRVVGAAGGGANKLGALCGNPQSSFVNNNFYADDTHAPNTASNNTRVNTETMDFSELPPAKELWGERKRGTTLLDVLNAMTDFYYARSYPHWVRNTDGHSIKFVLNGNAAFETTARFASLMAFTDADKMSFNGWYTDEALTAKLANYTITEDTVLYGTWAEDNKPYTIRFKEEGGVAVPQIRAYYGAKVRLPETTRLYHVFKGWVTEYGDPVSLEFTVPARDITLSASWVKTHILNAVELIELSDKVKAGTSFAGETIYLEDDIDFSGGFSTSFSPIGELSYDFYGVFDGQGHVVSNLDMQSISSSAALFGYADGITIRNVVVDSTCVISTTYRSTSYPTRLGGILGHCVGRSSPCTIENSVNMANFDFLEALSSTAQLYIGGVAGCLDTGAQGAIVRNCVNYGSIVYSGGDVGRMYIGGIVGSVTGKETRQLELRTCRVVNCLNSGLVAHRGFCGKPSSAGGIVGSAFFMEVVNCVNTGNVVNQARSQPNFIGAITGSANGTIIDRCYYDEQSTEEKGHANGYEETSAIISTRSFGSTLEDLTDVMNALNKKADEEGWSRWGTNSKKSTVKFTINCMDYASTTSPIIMYPELSGVDKSKFYGWYTDTRLTTLLNVTDISTGDTTLYAKWKDNAKYCSINITFEYMGTTSVVGHYYKDKIQFPRISEAALNGQLLWFTDAEMKNEYTKTLAEGEDITLYGKNAPVKFIVTKVDMVDRTAEVKSYSEKTILKDPNLCLDELCEDACDGDGCEVDEDRTLFTRLK